MSATLWATEWEARDAWLAQVVGIPCTCDSSLWSAGSQDCPHHGGENQAAAAAEQAAEIAAENAWLVAAEASTPEDDAFERWEAARLSPAEYDRVYGGGAYA